MRMIVNLIIEIVTSVLFIGTSYRIVVQLTI